MQLVLSNNRVIAYGESFVVKGESVIDKTTGAKYDNATVAECENYPNDIDEVGYEYHAGVFVPCAPYGMGSNNGAVMEVCEDCATPRSSGIPINDIKWSKIASVICKVDNVANSIRESVIFPVSDDVLEDYSMLRYKIKAGSTITFGYLNRQSNPVATQNFILLDNSISLFSYTTRIGMEAYGPANETLTFECDTVIPFQLAQRTTLELVVSDAAVINEIDFGYTKAHAWYDVAGSYIKDPKTLLFNIPFAGSTSYNPMNSLNVTVELEGRK